MFHIELNHLVRKKKLAKKFKEPQKREEAGKYKLDFNLND
jgi:hypothetical protein